MDENDSRESTHDSQADQAGLENSFTHTIRVAALTNLIRQ
jgi:hypothetical protein